MTFRLRAANIGAKFGSATGREHVPHALAIAWRVQIMRTGRVILGETFAVMAARGDRWDLV